MEHQNKTYQILVDKETGRYLHISIPNKQLSLCDLVPLMHTITNVLVEVAISKSDESVKCGPSCGICCRQLVPLSIPEVLYTVQSLLQMPVAVRRNYLIRFEENEEQLDISGISGKLRALHLTKEDRSIAREYFSLALPCPFLVNESCSIHSWRPVVCREFNSLSDPVLCTNPFENKIKTVAFRMRPSSVLARCCNKLTGADMELIPLSLLFENYQKYEYLMERYWEAEAVISSILDLVFE